MRLNIFAKVLVTYVVVVFLAMAVVGGMQYFMVQSYLLESKERELLVRSRELADLIKPILISGQDPHPVINSLNRADRILGTEAWVISSSGQVLAASANHWHCEGSTVEAADLKQLKNGRITVRKGQSQFFQEAVIQAATPILEQGKFIGAIILYTPVTGVNDAFTRMKEIFIWASVLGIIVSAIMGFLLSRYITRPLREVTMVAHGIADGNFSDRVQVKSRDEFGQLAETFNYMAQRLADYEQMRRDFVANVSHELRSPLTSVQGFIDALIEGKSKDKQEESRYLAILRKETGRLSKLVNELLEISGYDAQRVHFAMAPFPVGNVIKRAAASLKPRLDERDLAVITAVPGDIPLCYGDEDRIEQVVHNLLENAVRHSPQGDKILISARLINDRVFVEIADNGPGIPKTLQPRVWERFYRVDKARSRDKGGTGLGLAIVQEIVQKHGGQVSLDSEPGAGAVFGFTLPVVNRN